MKPKISRKKFRSGFEKSIALALTEGGVDYEFETVNIPYTLDHTNLGTLEPGDKVNLEFDILGKYVQKNLAHFKSQ